jgi:hypothetical protein
MVLPVLADDAGEETSSSPEEEADGKSADLAKERALSDVDGAISRDQGFAGFIKEETALGREASAPGVPIEECTTHLALQIGDLLTDSGLRDVKLSAGLAEGSVIGDGAKVT